MNFPGAYQELRRKLTMLVKKTNLYISSELMAKSFDRILLKLSVRNHISTMLVAATRIKFVKKRSSPNKCYFKAKIKNYTIQRSRSCLRFIILGGNKNSRNLYESEIRFSYACWNWKQQPYTDTPEGCYNFIRDSVAPVFFLYFITHPIWSWKIYFKFEPVLSSIQLFYVQIWWRIKCIINAIYFRLKIVRKRSLKTVKSESK